MLSNTFLIAALSQGTSLYGSGGFGLASYSASSASTKRIALAQAQLTKQLGIDQAKIAGFTDLETALAAFQSTVAGFQTAASVSSVQAASSDSLVATAAAAYNAGVGSYNLTVNQVAQTQTVGSGAFVDPNLSIVGSGTLSIQLGDYDSGLNTFTPGASPPVAINVTNGSLNSIAASINSAGAGVTANVVQDVDGYHLTLTSDSTGAVNGFSVTTTDLDGNDTDAAGLSQLAFDPTAAIGAGKNLTQTQAAQDAAYLINGFAATSASNTGIAISPGLTVNLSKAGSTTVSVTQSAAALTTAAQNLVDSFNSMVGTIKSLTGSGGALEGDGGTALLLSSLEGSISGTYAASGTLTQLYQLGITPGTDGTLSLDTTVLESSFAADPAGAIDLINTAALDYDTLVDPYTGGGGTIASVSKGLLKDASYLESLLPGLQEIGAQTQIYADQQFASSLALGYTAALNQSLFEGFPAQAFSLFA